MKTRRRINKIYSDTEIVKLLKRLHNKTNKNYGDDLSVTNSILDELYGLMFFCLLNKKSKEALECTELLKLVYGMAYTQKNISEDEYKYWHEITLFSIRQDEFQVTEYLLESAKILLRVFPNKQSEVVKTLKLSSIMSVHKDKLFISACTIDIALYWLAKFNEIDNDAKKSFIDLISSIGIASIEKQDIAFFREISNLLAQKISVLKESNENLFDDVFISWLNKILEVNLLEAIIAYEKILTFYAAVRQSNNNYFYSELLLSVGKYINKKDDRLLKRLLKSIFLKVYMYSNVIEVLSFFETSDKILKNIVVESDVIRFSNILSFLFYRFIFLETMRKNKDSRSHIRDLFFEQLALLFLEVAVLTAHTTLSMNELQILYLWRERFLLKSVKLKSRERIKKSWKIIIDLWMDRHPLKAEKHRVFLMRF